MGDCTTECFEIVVQPKPEDRRTNTGLKTHWLFSSMATFAFQFANPNLDLIARYSKSTQGNGNKKMMIPVQA